MKKFNLFRVDNPSFRNFLGLKKIARNEYGTMCFVDGKIYDGMYYVIFDVDTHKYSFMCPKGEVLFSL